MTSRQPDFIIIGAMKAGTTSLFRWLEQQPRCWLPSVKEPETLLRSTTPLADYDDLLAPAPPSAVTGEASVRYGDPRHLHEVTAAVNQWLPNTTLVYLVRDPEARLRSHYRHQRQRGRETRSLADAVADPQNPYLAHSRYADVVAGVHQDLGPERLSVWSFERLVGDDGSCWKQVLASLDLAPAARPDEVYNDSGSKGQFRPWLQALHDRGMLGWADHLPGPVRRLGRRGIDDSDSARTALDEAAAAPLPPFVTEELADQVERLRALLGDNTIA
ncbi:MAG: sulfotransferase domain-containing protein [Acidimicrobiales bacterium]